MSPSLEEKLILSDDSRDKEETSQRLLNAVMFQTLASDRIDLITDFHDNIINEYLESIRSLQIDH